MEGNWQHKLQQLEIVPPAKVWELLIPELQAMDWSEQRLSSRISSFEISPPPLVFDKVFDQLRQPHPGKLRALGVRRIAVAAIVVGIIGLASWFLLRQDSRSSIPSGVANIDTAARLVPKAEEPRQQNVMFSQEKEENIERKQVNRPNPGFARASYAQLVKPADIVTQPIKIEAPLIRDERGELILDKSLICPKNAEYIVVTGPNGEQTKISNKFLPLLAYLNSKPEWNDYSMYYDPESVEWKMRFDEWKRRLLQQTYAPTANNFLDIVELKEIIQEN